MGKLLLLLSLSFVVHAEEPLSWHKREAPTAYIELRAGDQPILRYNYGVQLPPGVPEDRARCCYIYPLWTPGGVSMLDDFPKDHYHHRGLFWAWPDIRVGETPYDGWMMKGLRTVNQRFRTELQNAGRVAMLQVENEWVAGGKTIATVQEQYEIHARDGRSRTLTATLTLAATGAPVVLRGSREDGKSYGGLSLRFAPREATVIRTENGVVQKDEDLTSHEWAELEAVYNGRKAAVRIDNAASNEGGPPQWCLRHYGFVGASFPGKTVPDKAARRDSFTVEPGNPLTLRYSVVVSDR